jgi:hypothetical protein
MALQTLALGYVRFFLEPSPPPAEGLRTEPVRPTVCPLAEIAFLPRINMFAPPSGAFCMQILAHGSSPVRVNAEKRIASLESGTSVQREDAYAGRTESRSEVA